VDAQLLAVNHGNQSLGAITLSVGVAVYPDHGSDAAAIVKAADIALFRAKSAGRNRTVMFEPALSAPESAVLNSPEVGA
jgi:diguanylate cyclase (GGDEF)-like protein